VREEVFVRSSIRLVVLAVVTALAAGACGGGGGGDEETPRPAPTDVSSPQVVKDGSLAAGEEIGPPEGEVVLTVSGAIGAANKGDHLELDLASLERMRTVRLATLEPFLKRRITFEGVLLADLLEVAGVQDSASKVSLTALDDYKVDFKVTDVRNSQMLLATKADGKHMPVDRSGPIRIVFPESSSLGRNPDLWIWSVSTMRVA
jgi:hypothetical protein